MVQGMSTVPGGTTEWIFSQNLHPTRITVGAGPHQKSVPVLIDSGVNANFLSEALAEELHVASEPLGHFLQVRSLNKTLLHRVRCINKPVSVSLEKHQVTLLLADHADPPLVLAIPWLQLHNPHVDWATCTVLGWSPTCHACCLRSAWPVTPTSWLEE